MEETRESVLIQNLIKMDDRAWEEFCQEYTPPLVHYVQLYFGCDQEKAEEIIHMTFVRCIRSMGNFNPTKGRLYAWLKAISRNEGHTLFGRDKSLPTPSFSIQSLNGMLTKIDSIPLPEEVLAQREVQLMIHEAIMDMNPQHRKVLLMKYIDQQRVSEIASMLDQSEKAIESLLSRARESFRNIISKRVKAMKIDINELTK